jgi:hypothetical protein
VCQILFRLGLGDFGNGGPIATMCLAQLGSDKRFARDFKLEYERSIAARMFTKQTRVACTQGLTADEPCCKVARDGEKRGTCHAVRRRPFDNQVKDRTQRYGFYCSATPTPRPPQSFSLDRAPHDVGHIIDGKFVLDFHDIRLEMLATLPWPKLLSPARIYP